MEICEVFEQKIKSKINIHCTPKQLRDIQRIFRNGKLDFTLDMYLPQIPFRNNLLLFAYLYTLKYNPRKYLL